MTVDATRRAKAKLVGDVIKITDSFDDGRFVELAAGYGQRHLFISIGRATGRKTRIAIPASYAHKIAYWLMSQGSQMREETDNESQM